MAEARTRRLPKWSRGAVRRVLADASRSSPHVGRMGAFREGVERARGHRCAQGAGQGTNSSHTAEPEMFVHVDRVTRGAAGAFRLRVLLVPCFPSRAGPCSEYATHCTPCASAVTCRDRQSSSGFEGRPARVARVGGACRSGRGWSVDASREVQASRRSWSVLGCSRDRPAER